MNVLLISDTYFPRVNGVSTSIRTFARALSRMGHAVTIVAPDYGPATGRDEGAGEFELIRLPARKVFFDPEDYLIRGSAMRGAVRDLSRRHWDVIHVHTPFRAHQLGVRLARATGRPTVETYHTHFEEYAALYLPWLGWAPLRWLTRQWSCSLCNEVDHLIVPTAQMAGVLQRYGIDTPYSVIPTGIDLDEFSGGSGERFRRAHGISTERPVMVTVSRLAREKNIGFLIDVLERLLPEFPDLLLVIAGEGPDALRLRTRVAGRGLENNVRFFGNLPRSRQLLDCYRAGDLFVFASPTETQGLVLIEAMALGLPIVSTAVLGTAAVLEHARGARRSAEDADVFAGHVADLLRSPESMADMAISSWLDARAWDATRWMEKVADLYRSLAGLDRISPRETPGPSANPRPPAGTSALPSQAPR